MSGHRNSVERHPETTRNSPSPSTAQSRIFDVMSLLAGEQCIERRRCGIQRSPFKSSPEIRKSLKSASWISVSSCFSWSKREELSLSGIQEHTRQECFVKRRVDGIMQLSRSEAPPMDVLP